VAKILANFLPAVHRVASLAKRWLLGTHQGAIDDAHLPDYLDEFVLRFNRRRSGSRGLLFYRVLQLAVDHDPVRYRDLIAQPQPEQRPRNPQGPAAIRRPWNAHPPGDPGETPACSTPVKWIGQTPLTPLARQAHCLRRSAVFAAVLSLNWSGG